MQSPQTGSGRKVVSSVVADLNEGNITNAVDEFQVSVGK
jgi:hypothetical protein